ncbi:MAG: hypothetical protein R6U17_00415 [Thermoplasmata archaeon]
MDLDDLNIFDRFSTGAFALVLGMAIIGTITYIIYVITPLFGVDSSVFLLSILVIILGIFIPLFFFIENIFDMIPDVIGKFLAGLLFAGIAWTAYHSYDTQGVGGIDMVLYMILPSLFAILTSLILVRGVIIPMTEGVEFEMDFDDEEGIITADEPDEDDLFEEEEDPDLFPEEEDDSW